MWIRVVCIKCKQGFQIFKDSKNSDLADWHCKNCRSEGL